ncbi:hypothetical protein AVEN_63000-1 [Araneus ventricosus]|uniref:Uncharacterized protein n=1 Tax=Araneus ventricosus TaxID=182803 RepID=A0A4Y2CS50_ARAVE|nr:hypothetical protein AVEN_63000-1 [Araneus ventricosus]
MKYFPRTKLSPRKPKFFNSPAGSKKTKIFTWPPVSPSETNGALGASQSLRRSIPLCDWGCSHSTEKPPIAHTAETDLNGRVEGTSGDCARPLSANLCARTSLRESSVEFNVITRALSYGFAFSL